MNNVLNAFNKNLGFVQARSHNGEPITIIKSTGVTIYDLVNIKLVVPENDIENKILICADGHWLATTKDAFLYTEAMIRVRYSTLLSENMLGCL